MEIFGKVINGIDREYSVRISPDDLRAIEEEGLNELAKEVRLDGFRPGKVPIRVVKNRYGAAIASQAKKKAVDRVLQFVSREEKLPKVIGYSTEVKKDDGTVVECVCKITTTPEFELQDMSGKKFTKYVYRVIDDDAKKILTDNIETVEYWKEIPGHDTVQEGDKILAHFTLNGKGKSGEALDNRDVELLIGDKNIVDDIWKYFIGHKVGDVCEFVMHFPKEASDKSLRGKEIPYKAEIKWIHVKSKFEVLDEEFAQYLGYKDLGEAVKEVKSREQARCDRISRNVLERDILDEISKMYDMELPQSMLDIEFKEVKRALSVELARLHKKDSPAVDEGCRKLAIDRAKIGFVVSKIAEQQKISVSRAEFERCIRNMIRFSPHNERIIYETYSRPENSAALLGTLLEEKVLDWMISEFEKNSQINDVSIGFEELTAKDEEMFDFVQNAEDMGAEDIAQTEKDLENESAEDKAYKELAQANITGSEEKSNSEEKSKSVSKELKETEPKKKTVRKRATKDTEEK